MNAAGHEERKRGVSKYSLFRLWRLNYDLMTGFSLIPIQAISIVGVLIAIMGFLFAIFLLARRFIIGPESEGLFTSRYSSSASSASISEGSSRRYGGGPGSS